MLTKAQMYSQMAEHVSSHITSSFEGWTSFLTTASKNYKYQYYDQLMIYAQRPDATACAEYDFWNDRMGRYVKRGSKGIALVDNSGEYSRLRYVFDISDTGTRQNSRKVRLWSMQDEYKEPIKQETTTSTPNIPNGILHILKRKTVKKRIRYQNFKKLES